METLAPTPEWMSKHDYEPPAIDQKTVRRAFRRVNGFEGIKSLEPEHHQAVRKLEKYYWGAQGVKVTYDDDGVRIEHAGQPDEFADFKYKGLLENAKKAVGSPRVWKAMVCQVEGTLSPQEIGHLWAAKKSPTGAKSWGEGLIVAGLDSLCMHWGLISKPP